MSKTTEEQVRDALRGVQAGPGGRDIVTLGMVSGIVIQGGAVAFAIEVDPAEGPRLEPLRHAAEQAVAGLPGVVKVTAVLTASRGGGPAGQPAQQPQPDARRQKRAVDGIAAIIAVASGKGGVGKSTTAVNLALALRDLGLAVGILDADIYGPSLPRLMGLSGRPDTADGRRLLPKMAFGLPCMSIGFLVPEDTPMIWRGPMVVGALQQLLRDVAWGELDVLVVDMPPGTGDAQLTMAQQVPLAGAVIVSTPQDLALLDARKGLNMFRKVDVPVLGIVENMSYFACPACGHRTDVFGHGGAHREAAALGVPFLGEVPLELAIRETSDAGTPIVAAQPDSPHARAYRVIAGRVAEGLSAPRRAAPRIVIED